MSLRFIMTNPPSPSPPLPFSVYLCLFSLPPALQRYVYGVCLTVRDVPPVPTGHPDSRQTHCTRLLTRLLPPVWQKKKEKRHTSSQAPPRPLHFVASHPAGEFDFSANTRTVTSGKVTAERRDRRERESERGVGKNWDHNRISGIFLFLISQLLFCRLATLDCRRWAESHRRPFKRVFCEDRAEPTSYRFGPLIVICKNVENFLCSRLLLIQS